MPIIGIPTASTEVDLLTVRQQFAKISGRHDLVTDYAGADYSDNGADRFINSGQKTLDRLFAHVKQDGRHTETLAIGGYYLDLKYLRSIKRVYLVDADSRFVPLEELELHTLLRNFDPKTSGTIKYWARGVNQTSPEQASVDLSAFEGVGDINQVDPTQQHSIIFNTPTDTAVEIQVFGRFFEKELVNDTDTSWWTLNQFDILVWAALYALEVSYNNMSGAKNWMDAITLQLIGLEKDQVELDDSYDLEEVIG
jgi:hypothetical protein